MLRLAPQDTYNYRKLREQTSRAGLHFTERLADDGKRLSDSISGAVRCIEGGSAGYLRANELREAKGGGRAHRGGGWRIYVGGGFGSQDGTKKVKKTLVL